VGEFKMNNINNLQAQFDNLIDANAWVDKKIHSRKWVDGKITLGIVQIKGNQNKLVYFASVKNPSPLICPYTNKFKGETLKCI
jgi:hypothetical protein